MCIKVHRAQRHGPSSIDHAGQFAVSVIHFSFSLCACIKLHRAPLILIMPEITGSGAFFPWSKGGTDVCHDFERKDTACRTFFCCRCCLTLVTTKKPSITHRQIFWKRSNCEDAVIRSSVEASRDTVHSILGSPGIWESRHISPG